MKKIVDERLKLQLLKNFKLVFLIENAVIILMLIYQSFENIDKAISINNPLWIALMVGTMSLSLISVNVTAIMADKPKRSILELLVYALLTFVISSLLLIFIMPHHILLIFLCGTIVTIVVSGLLIYENHYRH